MNHEIERAFWLHWDFEVFDVSRDIKWHDLAGVYVMAHRIALGSWRAVYIGSTTSFAFRLPGHEKWRDAARLGATHIHARVEKFAPQREHCERELIRQFRPPLNQVLFATT